jgi:hypothetical protein
MAYIVLKIIFRYYKKDMGPKTLFFIFIFANILDALHEGPIRSFSHSLLGTMLFSTFWIWFFHRYKIINRNHIPVLYTAVFVHIVTDTLFSNYKYLYPFVGTGYTVFGWNTPSHLAFEAVASVIILPILFYSGELQALRHFMLKETRKFLEQFSLKKLYNPELFIYYLYLALLAFVIAQFGINLFLNTDDMLVGLWYAWTISIAFIVLIYILASLSFTRENTKQMLRLITGQR